jgi:2-keto-3-deoxy-L-rhamnonate aldolase RhmA
MHNISAILCLAALCAAPIFAQDAAIFNPVKKKLAAGQKVIAGTVYSSDPKIYCAMANSGFDFMWIEMQHSALTYSQVENMIWACRDAPAPAFIRIPDATEGDIQKAMDIGALGLIVPMVDDAEKVKNAVKFSKYPPIGRRSQGGGQYRAVHSNAENYRQQINDNMMIIAMIENPTGVENVAEIAAVDGIDIIFAASGDLGSFSGKQQGDPEYEALVTKIHDEVLAAGKYLAGPMRWTDRHGYSVFQGPSEGGLIRTGAEAAIKENRGEFEY